MRTVICPECQGKRLRKEALAVKVGERSIADFVTMPIDELEAACRKAFGGKDDSLNASNAKSPSLS